MVAPKYYDFEDMVAKTIDVLKAYLPAEIASINTAKNQGVPPAEQITLSVPVAYNMGPRFVDPNPSKGTAIIVVTPSNEEGTDFEPKRTDKNEYIDVLLILWEEHPEIMERKIMRYAKAIENVLSNNPIERAFATYTQNIKDSVVSNIDYEETIFEGNMLMKSVNVRWKIINQYTY